MKTRTFLAIASLLFALATHGLADSKRTAEYLLSSPLSHENQQVTLDVSFVQPVRWVSPFPELAFFHALTIDRRDRKRGGKILVAVPAKDSEKFAKKYGMDFDGRAHSTTLRGEFIAAGKAHKRKIWMIDTTGQLRKLLAEKNQSLPDAAFDQGGQEKSEGFGRRGKRHP